MYFKEGQPGQPLTSCQTISNVMAKDDVLITELKPQNNIEIIYEDAPNNNNNKLKENNMGSQDTSKLNWTKYKASDLSKPTSECLRRQAKVSFWDVKTPLLLPS